MAFDFANPPKSRVTADLKGVAILLWGINGTGKTPIACGMDRPYYLAFEGGITAMNGVPYYPVNNWKDFLMFVKWATSPATTEEAHKTTQTIVLDTVDVMADYCIDYVCARLGVQSLGETRLTADGKRDGSVNAYTEYAREFKRATRALRNAGFTLVYIAHDGGYREDVDPSTHQRYNKMYPSGDKRAIEPICNDVDVIGYLQPAPVDADGHSVYSTIYFAPNNQFHTRCRYPDIVPFIPKVTAKILSEAIIAAKQSELDKTGVMPTTFEEQQAPFEENKTVSFGELQDQIKSIAIAMHEAGRGDEYREVVENYLGKGHGVMDTSKDQAQVLEVILSDLKDLQNK